MPEVIGAIIVLMVVLSAICIVFRILELTKSELLKLEEEKRWTMFLYDNKDMEEGLVWVAGLRSQYDEESGQVESMTPFVSLVEYGLNNEGESEFYEVASDYGYVKKDDRIVCYMPLQQPKNPLD